MMGQERLWSLITEEEAALLRVELLQRAANGYEQVGLWREAAECWAEQGKPSRAGELYAQGGDLNRAARTWLLAGRYHEALSAYCQWEQRLSKGNILGQLQALLGQAACHLLGTCGSPSLADPNLSEAAGQQAYQQARELLVHQKGQVFLIANCWEALGEYGGWLGRYDLVQEGYERVLETLELRAILESREERAQQVRICRAYLVQARAHADRLLCQQLEERLAAWLEEKADSPDQHGRDVASIAQLPNPSAIGWDIFSRLLKERIVFVNTPVDDKVANSIVAQLLYLQDQDASKDIKMYINSAGVSTVPHDFAGLAIYDTMQWLKPDVSTVCIGIAMGIGAILLAAGAKKKRFVLPNSTILIHQPLGGAEIHPDIEIAAREILRLRRSLYEILARHTGQTNERIMQDCDRNCYLTAQQAVEYGLVDDVLATGKEAISS